MKGFDSIEFRDNRMLLRLFFSSVSESKSIFPQGFSYSYSKTAEHEHEHEHEHEQEQEQE